MPASAVLPATRADVNDALLSPTTCSQQTVLAIRDLLDGAAERRKQNKKTPQDGLRPGPKEKYRRLAPQPTSRTAAKLKPGPAVRAQAYDEAQAVLSADEKNAFAVEVLNAVLQALSNAAKQARQTLPKKSPTKKNALCLRDRSPNAARAAREAKCSPAAAESTQTVPSNAALEALADCGGLALARLGSVGVADTGKQMPSAAKLEAATLAYLSRLVTLRLEGKAGRELMALKARVEKARLEGKASEDWLMKVQDFSDKFAAAFKKDPSLAQQRPLSAVRAFPAALQKLFPVVRNSLSVMNHGEVAKWFSEAAEGLRADLKHGIPFAPTLLQEVDLLRRAAIQYWSKHQDTNSLKVSSGIQDTMLVCRSVVLLCLAAWRGILESPALVEMYREANPGKQQPEKIASLAAKSIKTVIEVYKPIVKSVSTSWEDFDQALQDAMSLQRQLELWCKGANEDLEETQFVNISNLYWHWAPESGATHSDQTLRHLQCSCTALHGRPQEEKEIGLLVAKLYKTSQTLKSSKKSSEAIDTIIEAIKECIAKKTLLRAANNAALLPLQHIWEADGVASELGHILKTLMGWVLDDDDYPGHFHVPFDQPAIAAEERGILLEWQLELIAHYTASMRTRPQLPRILDAICPIILEIYEAKSYPMRRLRAATRIVHLFAQDVEFSNVQTRNLAESICSAPLPKCLGKDEALSQYAQHLQASANVCLAFLRPEATAELLKAAMTIWSALTNSCSTSEDFRKHIDDPDRWASQLRSMTQFFNMQGLEADKVMSQNLLTQALELVGAQSKHDVAVAVMNLGSDLLHLGYSSRAGLCLARSQQDLIEAGTEYANKVQWHLTYAEYALGLGNTSKWQVTTRFLLHQSLTCISDEHLLKAKALFEQQQRALIEHSGGNASRSRIESRLSLADACYVATLRELVVGRYMEALCQAKKALKLLQRAWNSIESKESLPRIRSTQTCFNTDDNVASLTQSMRVMKVAAPLENTALQRPTPTKGSMFWPLVPRIHRLLLLVSRIYHQSGMYQEAIYYTEKARKLAEQVDAKALLLRTLISHGDYANRSGSLQEGKSHLERAESLQQQFQISQGAAIHHRTLGHFHHLQSRWQGELTAYGDAENVLDMLLSSEFIYSLIGGGFTKVSPVKQQSIAAPDGRTTTSSKVKGRGKAPTKGKPEIRVSETKTENYQPISSALQEAPRLLALKNDIMRRKAESMLAQGDLDGAYEALKTLIPQNGNLEHTLHEKCARARQLLLSADHDMSVDPVFTMLSESTMSYPAISLAHRRKSSAALGTNSGHPLIMKRESPSLSPKKKSMKQLPVGQNFVSHLQQALGILSEIVSHGSRTHSNANFAQACSLLTSISMIYSYAQPGPFQQSIPPALLAHSIEAPRTIAAARERQAIQQDLTDSNERDTDQWPDSSHAVADLSYLSAADFQSTFLDIIPDAWLVISLALSERHDALYVARYQSGRDPFVLRLPLARQSSHGGTEESFSFDEAKSELVSIVRESDATVHNGRDNPESFNVKGAKTKWWNQREELDHRLHELLLNIENIWLGGFSGVFSQQTRHVDLLARFQRSFENILQKHLPSRQRIRKQTNQTLVRIESQIFDLFVGLGDPTDEEVDLDEPLTDLLYFVVDILQFHGEPNAYDEIDFDAMIVETLDALCSYHEAAQLITDESGHRHTILIVDKQLHPFPWEGLPCLRYKSVSRLPSIGDLRDRILTMQAQRLASSGLAGIEASISNGTSILNPSLDLPKTQARFSTVLSNLSDSRAWIAITARVPSEAEFARALTAPAPPAPPNILLYFGHGSGAQYVRARTIKRLAACNVALLFGCSSASLKEAGEYEPYGTPRSYMLGGCPAVLGSLWDVTDGDCDAFAAGVLERWGLAERGDLAEAGAAARTKGKGKAKGKQRAVAHEDERLERMSLSDAVAKSKDDCYLRYLNGAAMVVYGVPVYLTAS